MRKTVVYTLLIFSFLALLAFAAPETVRADGMKAKAGAEEVKTGEKIPVTVSFTGTEIWFALVEISLQDPILEGEGTFLIEPERGESFVSETYELEAVSPGTTKIKITGYTDEDESQVFTVYLPVTVNGAEEAAESSIGTGRTAEVDRNYRDRSGAYINRKKPPSVTGGSAKENSGSGETESDKSGSAAGNEKKKDSAAEEKQASGEKVVPGEKNPSGTDSPAGEAAEEVGKNETENPQTRFPVALIVLIAAVLLITSAVVVPAIRRKKMLRTAEQDQQAESDGEFQSDEKSESGISTDSDTENEKN